MLIYGEEQWKWSELYIYSQTTALLRIQMHSTTKLLVSHSHWFPCIRRVMKETSHEVQYGALV